MIGRLVDVTYPWGFDRALRREPRSQEIRPSC
jgi:hypothetical protein